MSAETVAVAALLAAAPVTTLVGDKVYPDFVPVNKALPSIAMQRASTENVTTIHTALPEGAFVNLEIWCMAASRKAAEELADKATAGLAGVSVEFVGRIPEVVTEDEVFASVVIVSILEQ